MRTYLEIQRDFWNVDPHTSKFGRVDTVSANEIEYERMADDHYSAICSGVAFRRDMTILEIGCGVGRIMSRMQRQPHGKLIGVDISENMIELARKAMVPDSRVELYANSGADLSMVPDNSVEFCYSNDVFIHIADVDVVRRYFREVARVLRSQGLFRFNVRALDLNRMFSNTPGGLAAKASYMLGLRKSMLSHRPGVEGFSGLHFRHGDIRALAADVGLASISISPAPDPSGGGFLWCEMRKI
jgi:SAM-dependent methyltransferase